MNTGHTIAYITEIDTTTDFNPDFINLSAMNYTGQGGYWKKAVEDKNLQMCEIAIDFRPKINKFDCYDHSRERWVHDLERVLEREWEFAVREVYGEKSNNRKNSK